MFVFTERITDNTIHIVNVSNSSSYVVSNVPNLGGSLTIYGDPLYVKVSNLTIVDVSEPEHPDIIWSGALTEKMGAIRIYSNTFRVYLVMTYDVEIGKEAEQGVRIANVTNPSRPELLDRYYVSEEITNPYWVAHYNLANISGVYPHLFAFETIEYYGTSYWGDMITDMCR